jgi:hypothetical protein
MQTTLKDCFLFKVMPPMMIGIFLGSNQMIHTRVLCLNCGVKSQSNLHYYLIELDGNIYLLSKAGHPDLVGKKTLRLKNLRKLKNRKPKLIMAVWILLILMDQKPALEFQNPFTT